MADPTTVRRKCDAMKAAEANGEVADSLDVRKALIRRVEAGEITLAQAQAELRRLKRGAEWRKSTKNLYCEWCGGLVWAPVEHKKHHVPGCRFEDKEQSDV